MRTLRPDPSSRTIAFATLALLASLSTEALADSECPAKGSSGCWASACVFTPEALFINGKPKDGYRRAEYIIPEKGRIKYRTVRYFDAECTKPDTNEISEWLEDSKNFRRFESKTIDATLTVEQVGFGPFAHGAQGMVAVRGRFYVLEKNLLCTSSNLLYAEDGPAIDLRPSSDPNGATLRRSCLSRLTELATPPIVKIVGTIVPPYPQGFDSFEGSCIPGKGQPFEPCQYTIGILQATRDDRHVGIFAGTKDRIENDLTHWKVTDYIEHPTIPAGHVFASVGCELNGAEDETVIAVLGPNERAASAPTGFGTATWARKLNVATGRFVEIAPSSVRCPFDAMAEGHYGGSVDTNGDARAP